MHRSQVLTPGGLPTGRAGEVRALLHLGVGTQLLVLLGAEALLLVGTGTGLRHQGAHLGLAALLVLVALLAEARRRGRQPRLPVLAILAGHLLTVVPVLGVTGGTGGTHPASLAVTDTISGYLSGPELGWYGGCVALLAAVLVVRWSALTLPVDPNSW